MEGTAIQKPDAGDQHSDDDRSEKEGEKADLFLMRSWLAFTSHALNVFPEDVYSNAISVE
jgi:hypothetical protein